MYFVLGVLTAGLLALAVTPAIWRRAIRLTRARLEATVPMTLAEIQADKDQLRAEFAIANRRLEMAAASLEGRAAEQAVAVNRYRAEAARLGGDLATKVETIRSLETQVADLDAAVKGAEARIVAAKAELAKRDATLTERAARIKTLEGELNAAAQLSEEQKLELVARNTEIGNLKDQLAASRSGEEAVAKARDELDAELAVERARLAAEQLRAEGLEARIVAFEAERVDRLAALERRAGEIKALEAKIAAEALQREHLAAEVARLEAEREARIGELAETAGTLASLRAEIAGATVERRRVEEKLAATETELAAATAGIADLRTRVEGDAMTAGDNVRKAIAAAEEEKTALQARLEAIEASHAALLAENVELRRVGGPRWEAERGENARLRRRLAEIAADVARMALATTDEGPATAPAENGAGNGEDTRKPAAAQRPAPQPTLATADTPPPRPLEGRSLAERIRALQHTAARH